MRKLTTSGLHFSSLRIPRWFRLAVYAVVFFFLAAALVSGWDRIKEYQWEFKPGFLLILFVVFAIYLIVQAVLTTWIVRRMKLPIRYRAGVTIFLQAWMTRYVPGGVWPFATVAAAGQEMKLPSRLLVVALMLKEIFGIVASACFALPLLFIRFGDQPALFGVLVLVLFAAGLVLAPFLLRVIVNWIVRWRKLTVELDAERITSIGGFFTTLLAFAGAQAIYLLAAYLYLLAVADLPPAQLLYAALAMNGAWLFGLLFLPAPQGLGAREAAMVFLLLPFVDSPVAVALSLGFRVVTTLVDLLLFVALLIGSARRGVVAADG